MQSVTRTINGRNYATSYQFNTIDQTTQLTYPSGRVVNASYDGSARLASLAAPGGPQYISNMAYDANGNLTGWTLGNGVHEGFGYDANRLQPILHTAGTSAPYTNRMNISYSYQAAAGQMGASSTAGNAGQLISISGTINGTNESASYTWDNLGRLITSNQGSNGSSAQRRFAYDRWGNSNRDVGCGKRRQSDSKRGASAERGRADQQAERVTTSGVTANYSYDAAGNVTSDGAHTYSYDALSRLVAVDSGSTASYAYDQQNRRIRRVVGGSSTHYVWEGSLVLAEHDGNSGAQILDYVYANGKLIAKGPGTLPGFRTYFLSDRMSERVAMNSLGNVVGRQGHLPFGEDFGESGVQEKHHFTTYERDSETGNDYALNRVYTSSLGRFLSSDPYSPTGCNDPRGWNRYSYTRNVVINRGDPLGLTDGPIDGGCPPGGTAGGPFPGRCLCITAPEACSRRFGPPNVDGHGDGPGGGRAAVEDPLIFFDRATWDIVSVAFEGNLSAEIPLDGRACQGSEFTVSVYYRVLNSFGSLYVHDEVTASQDGAFKVIRSDTRDDGRGDGEVAKKRADIRLIRKGGGQKTGVLKVTVKTLGKDRQPAQRLGVVRLKCF